MYDKLLLLCTAQVLGNAGSEYTDDPGEINFGVTTPAPNKSGQFGLHVVVTTTFATLTSGAIIWIVDGASTAPTGKHTGAFFSAAQLVAGKHYFIPCSNRALLQYARGYFEVVSENATAGACTMYFGPPAPPGN
jgi:hypothetical protein